MRRTALRRLTLLKQRTLPPHTHTSTPFSINLMRSIAVKNLYYCSEYFAFRDIFHSAMTVYLMRLEIDHLLSSHGPGMSSLPPFTLLHPFVYGKGSHLCFKPQFKIYDPPWHNLVPFLCLLLQPSL